MKCPHCNKIIRRNEQHDKAESNCESYGSNWFTFKHSCGKYYSIYYSRRVIIDTDSIQKASQDYASFGG